MSDTSERIPQYALIGDEKVGKATLLKRFADIIFDQESISTNDDDVETQSMKLTVHSIQIGLNTTDQNAASCQDIDGIIIVFDLTNIESFNNVQKWIDVIKTHGYSQVNKFLIGNKCDLTEQRTIQYEKAKELADLLGISYIETSAEDRTNIKEAFQLMTKNLASNLPAISDIKDNPPETKIVETSSTWKPNTDHSLKLALIGDSGVGKSTLLLQFADGVFNDSYISTIAVDHRSRSIEHGNKKIKLRIWDTAGQERFQSMITAYYRNADGIIIIFDVTDKESFDNIQKWLDCIDIYGDNRAKKLIVGNKADLKHHRVIAHEKAEKFANSLNIPYMETSAKTTQNVEEIFKTLVGLIEPDQSSMHSKDPNIQICSENKSKKTTSGFC